LSFPTTRDAGGWLGSMSVRSRFPAMALTPSWTGPPIKRSTRAPAIGPSAGPTPTLPPEPAVYPAVSDKRVLARTSLYGDDSGECPTWAALGVGQRSARAAQAALIVYTIVELCGFDIEPCGSYTLVGM
jgi:hypothetical protein